MKTLYISDLDGTLLQPNIEISENSVKIINDLIQNGMLFSIATARTIATVKPILKDITITLPVILMNGVCIYDLSTQTYLNVEYFTLDNKKRLLSIIKENNLKGFVYGIKDGIMSTYYEDLNQKPLYDFYLERITKYKKPFTQVDHFDSLIDSPLMYFFLLDKKEMLEPITQIIEATPDLNYIFYKDNYSTDLWYLEVFSKNASKYHAVQYLRKHLNFDTIVCFGDNRNDIALFEASDYKYAVGNAVNELKEKADAVIGNNTDDGVAMWLLKNVPIPS